MLSSPNGEATGDRRGESAAKSGKKHVGGKEASRSDRNAGQRSLCEAVAIVRAPTGRGLNPIVGNAGENNPDRNESEAQGNAKSFQSDHVESLHDRPGLASAPSADPSECLVPSKPPQARHQPADLPRDVGQFAFAIRFPLFMVVASMIAACIPD
jgi:hypothetical protein